VKSAERLAMPVSALALAFSALALPMTYLTVPFCRPAANYLSWTATVGIVSAAGAIGLAAVLLSLFSVYSLGTAKARTSLMMAVGSLGIATAYIVFGLALRTCPA
jgi:hypothetical protein